MRLLMCGGTVVDDGVMRRADVAIEGKTITAVGDVVPSTGDQIIECHGRLVLPGFVDVHSHTDGLVEDNAVQQALLKQGVTTVVTGQDGVSYAPGSGEYASNYFAAINGRHPHYDGGGVAGYLAAVQGRSRLNFAYLVPAGTVRSEVCGRSSAPANESQIARMVALVEQGMREGAVGVSTGLDYVPGIFATADEIAALCSPVAAAGGLYVTHMRGGYEANSAAGITEIAHIAAESGARVHISHFHAQAAIISSQLQHLRSLGVDTTFDAYPYTRGCTLLAMPLLPPELSVLPVETVVDLISDPGERTRLRRDWFPKVERNASLGPDWPSMITLAHIAAPEFAWAHGLTLEAAAMRAGTDAIEIALDLLAASQLEVNAVMAVPHQRSVVELATIFSHEGHMGGSDGIFIGAHPHPRARGTFARYLREYVRETPTWSWPEAVQHLSTAPAARFSLGQRGRIAAGWEADLIVVDPHTVADTATYEKPLAEAIGIDDVVVAGQQVLASGRLATTTPGRGLRREHTKN
ncbi:N-acyl-D-aspartate/D-glutamate deacylase [Arthrobacter livingstonensis]|uniref:N-acyl-D-aspartate/D-glutamate deacylase n=1 Tax=Arthrobacter livingstonensis TaxID=670078 RepID=A0A2V5L0Z6_9MICC|nr:amidohydrolase family protein [Arthrobacter livingstonensis]PYI64829.1 N-acyl-D-aspartate/D-glutamate deacylase [Arthrobacter livingstonensis]